MTHRTDVAQGRDIVARWCDLAEQRLEYLTELFETGRWRRFHSELAFLENIQEAKRAVETWRNLLKREASLDNSAIDMSWLRRSRTPLPYTARMQDRFDRRSSPPIAITAQPPVPPVASIPAEPIHVVADDAPSVPSMEMQVLKDVSLLTLDAIAQRYPLLRNAL